MRPRKFGCSYCLQPPRSRCSASCFYGMRLDTRRKILVLSPGGGPHNVRSIPPTSFHVHIVATTKEREARSPSQAPNPSTNATPSSPSGISADIEKQGHRLAKPQTTIERPRTHQSCSPTDWGGLMWRLRGHGYQLVALLSVVAALEAALLSLALSGLHQVFQGIGLP